MRNERLGSVRNLENLGRLGITLKLTNQQDIFSTPLTLTPANYHLDTCLLAKAIPSLTHPQAPASAGDVSSAEPRQKSGHYRLWVSEVADTTD